MYQYLKKIIKQIKYTLGYTLFNNLNFIFFHFVHFHHYDYLQQQLDYE